MVHENDIEQDSRIIEAAHLEHLFEALVRRGYRLIGPAVRDGAITLEELGSTSALPRGWADRQEGGSYRLQTRSDGAFFGFGNGPHSLKKFLHPALIRLWSAGPDEHGFRLTEETGASTDFAFVGVRSCDLHAVDILDRVFLRGQYVDPGYRTRRERIFIVAVDCSRPGGTCFCASMGTGPAAVSGFDLALTEVMERGRHFFVVRAGSERGADLVDSVPHRPAEPEDAAAARRVVDAARDRMGRTMDAADLPGLLSRSYESPRWEEVALRCLTCGNCTMVCPTCFCTTLIDTVNLKGDRAERWRRWDSCFSMDFSYIHGGNIRSSAMSRYRQWLTHKVGTWVDQFGVSGCVGCGRCITWCPVAIDITEELRAIRDLEEKRKDESDGNA
jgi:sulfhydrogenase subunit beta (sulfur reductase)